MSNRHRYVVKHFPVGWAVVDHIAQRIVCGAESKAMAREFAAEFEVSDPNGVEE